VAIFSGIHATDPNGRCWYASSLMSSIRRSFYADISVIQRYENDKLTILLHKGRANSHIAKFSETECCEQNVANKQRKLTLFSYIAWFGVVGCANSRLIGNFDLWICWSKICSVIDCL